MKKNCEVCGKEINVSIEYHYCSNYGDLMCEECGDERLNNSSYGFYDTEADHGDPDLMLDDDLADVSFYHEVNR